MHMNFEKPISLYPERASSNLDVTITHLQDIENGKIKRIEFQETERADLLSFENTIGESLEKIVKIKNISLNMHIGYLLTATGIEDFNKIFDLDISSETSHTVEQFLYKHRNDFLKSEPIKRNAFSGRAEKFADDNLLNSLTGSMNENGDIDIGKVSILKQVDLLLAPEKALEKLTLLRNFKRGLKFEIESIQQLSNISALETAKLKILNLYKRKVNQLLAENFSQGVVLQKMSDAVGIDSLTVEEKTLLELFQGLSMSEKNYSRYDKFIHGATTSYNEFGNKTQVSQEIIDFADKLDLERLEIELHKEDCLKERGLDSKKIFEKNIDCEQFSAIEESLLRHYGILSAYPASEYDPADINPASDNKWRFIARSEFKSMSVNSGRKIVKAPRKNQSAETMITVLCGHETEGHVIQNINREKIPLKLFNSEYLGGDRTSLFAEGGAMMIQNIISQKAFGFQSLPHSAYIRAMIKKIEGGSYIDCIKSFYDNQKLVFAEKRNRGIINNSDFQKEIHDVLELSINRCKRLFRSGVDKNSDSPFLTKSKDTVYLEQLMLMSKLQQQGMEKYAFVGSVNLRTLADLAEIGFINLSQIRKPDLYSLEIWNKIKDNYKISDKDKEND